MEACLGVSGSCEHSSTHRGSLYRDLARLKHRQPLTDLSSKRHLNITNLLLIGTSANWSAGHRSTLRKHFLFFLLGEHADRRSSVWFYSWLKTCFYGNSINGVFLWSRNWKTLIFGLLLTIQYLFIITWFRSKGQGSIREFWQTMAKNKIKFHLIESTILNLM